jgi:hypothetical protein
MVENTKLLNILSILNDKDGWISSHELAKQSGIEIKQVTPYYYAIITKVQRAKMNGLWHYKIRDSCKIYIKKYLERKLNENRDW